MEQGCFIFFLRIFCQFKKSFYLCIRKQKEMRLQERKRSAKDGPFVYRLGRKIFILERGHTRMDLLLGSFEL